MISEQALASGAAELGVSFSEGQVGQFSAYAGALLDWNSRVNLTAITDPSEITVKHFLDSLSVLFAAELPQGASVVDVGTGAGFPGVPMLIARPDLQLTLLDSTAKRITFLEVLLRILGLKATTIHARAEEAGRDRRFRGVFDCAVSRAVAPLPVLCEYCLPFVRTGGIFIAMKGREADAETKAALPAISALNSQISDIKRLTLPQSDISRVLIVIRKLRQIPKKYPRTQSQITKSPIK